MRKQFLLFLFIALAGMGSAVHAQERVIAHRGYWDTPGSAQNSQTSLRKALALSIYGSETDIWLTKDGHLMVNHDPQRNGVTFQTSAYKQCKKLKLENGERISQLKDFLKIMRKSKSCTKLIIEVKPHATALQSRAAAQLAVKQVRKYGVQDKVEYISFSLDACKEIVADDPGAKVAYLNGELSPEQLHAMGITGIDYHMNVLRKHPEWIGQAHNLGMTTNVWTVNSRKDIKEFAKDGVDYITTNKPLDAIDITRK